MRSDGRPVAVFNFGSEASPSPSSALTANELLLRLEAGISWDAVNASWKSNRKVWCDMVRNASTAMPLGEALAILEVRHAAAPARPFGGLTDRYSVALAVGVGCFVLLACCAVRRMPCSLRV